MDSQVHITSHSMPIIDDFENMEMTQFDEDTLRELLEEPIQEVQEQSVDSITQPMVVEIAPHFTIDESSCSNSLKKIEDCTDDNKWKNMIESSLNDTITFTPERVTEFFDLREFGLWHDMIYSHDLYYEVPSDDIGYDDGLWYDMSS
ncbi:hypothetical protein H5410_028100 [Solanum commersonii]|uniref:Uncharacterized protein n=1 Tax=Solanum commersonii TaxID=4109 RepID=A0A9J5Z3U9_SOLCO|nr:hypothetical protein H5410_028100 [Solanum commersonii]